MRITQNMLQSKYIRNLNANLRQLDYLNDQSVTGRKFFKPSEAPASAMRAYAVRRDVDYLEQYMTNLDNIQGIIDETESAVTAIKDILQDARVLMLDGRNGTKTATEREMIGDQILRLRDQILLCANTKAAGTYILGGSNTLTPPFTLDDNGNILYNGLDMQDPATYTNEKIFYDLGMGLSFDNGVLNENSAISVIVPGDVILGVGENADGISNNIYNLLTGIGNAFKDNDMTQFDAFLSQMDKKENDCLKTIATVGQNSNFCEFLQTRYSNDLLLAQERMNTVEFMDPAEAITYYKMQEMAYKAALQMGQRILQPSLLDFMR